MEEFSHLGGGSGNNGGGRGYFLYHLPSSVATGITATSAAYSQGYIANTTNLANNIHHPSSFKAEVAASSSQMGAGDQLGHHGLGHLGEISHGGDHLRDDIKAKIMSHPRYSSLLGAFMECQKVGAPPEVVSRLSAMTRELDSRSGRSRHELPSDPELDQFMEAYSDMLVKYREELTRPLQEATDYLKSLESQFNALTSASSSRLFSSDAYEKCEAGGSSEEEQDGSGGEAELPEFDPHAEDKELKNQLLKKYSGYLTNLRQELSKKKKKGKLPKEARQKLLNWWELHYKWPYPSETEKLALAESTGLDQKQINNWFINQRKRHWKPSEDMQFVMMDGFHPQHAASAYFADGQFLGDGIYRLGP